MSYPRPAVALMQPTFLPWQGYFALIDSVDQFVFLDDFQFCRRSFMHRNRLFLAAGNPGWVSLPVEHHGSDDRAALNQVKPLHDDAFRRKIMGMLRHSYGGCAHYARYAPEVEAWLAEPHADLASFNIAFIRRACQWLGLRAEFKRSSEIGSSGKRSSRLVDLLRRLDARTYLSARGSYEYMVEDAVFPLADIETRFQRFEPQAHAQKQSPMFVAYLSVLDALLQLGPERTLEVIRQGSRAFVPWAEMQGATAPTEMADDQSH
jgi:hypothetical protein